MNDFSLRSNLITGAYYRDTSKFVNGAWVPYEYDHVSAFPSATFGTPCKGDGGTSLMVKEHKRLVNFFTFHIVYVMYGLYFKIFSYAKLRFDILFQLVGTWQPVFSAIVCWLTDVALILLHMRGLMMK